MIHPVVVKIRKVNGEVRCKGYKVIGYKVISMGLYGFSPLTTEMISWAPSSRRIETR